MRTASFLILFLFTTIFSFSQEKGTFIDKRDGRVYKTVKLGNQVWMSENLKYLPQVAPSSSRSWGYQDSEPFFFVYGYEGNSVSDAKKLVYFKKHGVLYNNVAAGLACPKGWRLPSIKDFKILGNYFKLKFDIDENVIGFYLKSSYDWNEDGNGSDKFGFEALPSGYMSVNNTPTNRFIGLYANYWTSDRFGTSKEFRRSAILAYNNNGLKFTHRYDTNEALCIRCIKVDSTNINNGTVSIVKPKNDTIINIYPDSRRSIRLKWNAYDPNGSVLTYNLYCGYSREELELLDSEIESDDLRIDFSLEDLMDKGITLYWQIESVNVKGEKARSPISKFSVISKNPHRMY